MSEGLQKLGDNPVFKELVELLRKQTPQQCDRLKEYMENQDGSMSEADKGPTGEASQDGDHIGRRVA